MQISSAHFAAIFAFIFWGLFPLYWKLFSEVSPWDLFGHRLIWSFLTVFFILFIKNKLSKLREIWKNKQVRYMLIISSILISSNWLLYIYAVSINKVLEASMGYFLNPIINVFFGWLFLKEDIRRMQWPAILLAIFSIILLVFQSGINYFPWIAMTLSMTFAAYGIIRKLTHVGSLEGLSFETSIIILPTLLYWYFLPTSPSTIFNSLPTWKIFALSASGLITCTPLILFSFSARRIKLQTLGFIQYLSPSLKFVCGLFILNEPLNHKSLQSFILIWLALLWYSTESFIHLNQKKNITDYK